MGAYWGCKYIAFLPKDLLQAKVVQVDLKPCGVNITSDELHVAIGEKVELKGHAQFNQIKDAKLEVRRHILTKTHDKICELLCAIECAKHDIEIIKLTEIIDIDNEARIKNKEEQIVDFSGDLKRLRKLRKAKITVD